MQLPQFIQRMLGFVEKAEKNLTAEERLATVLKDLEAAKASLVTANETSAKALADVKAALEAKEGEIATLKAAIDTEKGRANQTIAAQGVPADLLPAAEAGKGTQGETAYVVYHRLLAEDPQAAGAYYQAHSKDICATRQ